jgi:hypothetical protein
LNTVFDGNGHEPVDVPSSCRSLGKHKVVFVCSATRRPQRFATQLRFLRRARLG